MSYCTKMYKRAYNDKTFRAELGGLPSNKMPLPIFADVVEEGVWTAGYYGWLIGKYGLTHAEEVKRQCKE